MSLVNSETVQDLVVKQAEGPYQLIACTSQIVSSLLVHQKIETSEITNVIDEVFQKLRELEAVSELEGGRLRPAVPVADSVSEDFITCLEDGKKFKMLKKHLMSVYGMTPNEYRRKWNLDPDYPMTAPSYALKRQELAKKIGLGRKRA
jgi:predicted transcriptional regulator